MRERVYRTCALPLDIKSGLITSGRLIKRSYFIVSIESNCLRDGAATLNSGLPG